MTEPTARKPRPASSRRTPPSPDQPSLFATSTPENAEPKRATERPPRAPGTTGGPTASATSEKKQVPATKPHASSAQTLVPAVKTHATGAKALSATPLESAPAGPTLRAWVDGGARGNPGPAGYGAHIEDEDGNLVRDVNGFLGIATNNVAEYQGLLAALRTARELGAHALTVLADAQLIVRQMKGEYRVKDAKLRPLFLQAQALAAGIPHFTIQHVPREENGEADRLANEAMDRGR